MDQYRKNTASPAPNNKVLKIKSNKKSVPGPAQGEFENFD